MNTANKLTLLRFLLVPIFIIFMIIENIQYSYFIATIIFTVAAFTDFLDGYIARKYNMVTDFGKFMDPLADKLLTTVALIYLIRFGLCSEIVLSIVLAREFAVSGIRMIVASSKEARVIAASFFGKAKTVLQMVSIIFALLLISFSQSGMITAELYANLSTVVNILMWTMALATALSGIQYIAPNYHLIKNAK